MDAGVVVPVAFFAALTAVAVTHILNQARTRRLLIERGTSGEAYAAVLAAEGRLRALAALRWGLALAGLAVGFLAADALGHRPFADAPGSGEGVVLLGLAAGLVASYALTRNGGPVGGRPGPPAST